MPVQSDLVRRLTALEQRQNPEKYNMPAYNTTTEEAIDEVVVKPVPIISVQYMTDAKITYEIDLESMTQGEGRAVNSMIELSQIYAECHRQHMTAYATYRHWKADAFTKLIREDPKAGEWKAKAQVEAHPDYLGHKKKIARLEHALFVLRTSVDALRLALGMDSGAPIIVADPD